MLRRDFLKLLGLSTLPALGGCGLTRLDRWNVLLRSDVIQNFADETRIVDKAKLYWTEDSQIRVLVTRGSAYERGYQHGKLLQKEIGINIGYLYRQALEKFPIPELFDESYERMRPYIPEDYLEEMRGLAHGARLPLSMVHHIHVLPDIGEWGGKKRLVKIAKQMFHGDPLNEWGTTCSNFCFSKDAAQDNGFYTVRILDWGLHRVSRLHEFPLININIPENGVAHANIGWVGFLGAVSGMNAQGITLGEMGYGDPPGEILNGIPMTFLLREVLRKSSNLADVRKTLKDAKGSNSYVFLMSDGKTRESEMYIKDAKRFLIHKAGEEFSDGKTKVPAINDILFGGHYVDRMTKEFTEHRGELTPEFVMKEVIPKIAMPSNFQNVVYDPSNLRFWVSNAPNRASRAAESPYTLFDLKRALADVGA